VAAFVILPTHWIPTTLLWNKESNAGAFYPDHGDWWVECGDGDGDGTDVTFAKSLPTQGEK
jgi:hypothetical protein